jgi:hypothetical protein
MTLRERFADRLFQRYFWRVAMVRAPDFIIGANNPLGPYLFRWFLSPWSRWYRDVVPEARNQWQRFVVATTKMFVRLYLHCFRRDDDDRAHHDHPSIAFSLILFGACIEHTIAAGGVHHRRVYRAGSFRFMRLHHAHRIELFRDASGRPMPCWTLFIFGPDLREWGFHCPERGWVHWKIFTANDDGSPGDIGRGCG